MDNTLQIVTILFSVPKNIPKTINIIIVVLRSNDIGIDIDYSSIPNTANISDDKYRKKLFQKLTNKISKEEFAKCKREFEDYELRDFSLSKTNLEIKNLGIDNIIFSICDTDLPGYLLNINENIEDETIEDETKKQILKGLIKMLN